MVKGRSRLTTDAVREVRNTFSRFLSILVLSALAVAFLAGLRATAPDMEYTADNYYDRTRFMDGYVLSTMGLTEDDLAALAAAPGIGEVEGARTVDAIAVDAIVSVRSMPERLNLLEVTRGRLPQRADECVTEELLLVELGLSVGDLLKLTLGPDNEGDLEYTEYTIVGVVSSPLYVGTDRGSSSLGSGKVNAFMYIPGENFNFDHYTAAYFTAEGFAALDSYSDEYDDKLDALINSLDGLAEERAQLRSDSLIGEAQTRLDDAQRELDEARAEAERELDDARRELEDARQELDDGWADYRQGLETFEREIQNAQQELDDARQLLQDSEKALEDGRQKYEEGMAAYRQGMADYEDGVRQYENGLLAYQAGLAEYERGLAAYEAGVDTLRAMQQMLDAGRAEYESLRERLEQGQGDMTDTEYEAALAALDTLKTVLDDSQARIDAGWAELDPVGEQLADAWEELEDARLQLEDTAAVLKRGQAELDSSLALLQATEWQLASGMREVSAGWAQYADGVVQLAQARMDGQAELDDALAKLEDGEAQYADGLAQYEEGRAEAEEKIAGAQATLDDARRELEDVENCKWYVLGRNTNSGFAGYAQDAERVGNLANVFPVIFFLVAALACLTTMTRMVEEQRTQIGALKALGFSRVAISKKYIGYAFFASLIGGLLGLALGCTVFPLVIANAFDIMYNIPPLEFKNQVLLCVLSVLAAVLCTTGAALWACLSTLVDTPANLMRPKAPKAGKRVFLEYIRPLWRRLSFTWKVTMRNLFRYQRRFWMTVIGIGGCTALIVTGFGLHDSIFSILDRQFDEISIYDATVGLNVDASRQSLAEVEDYLNASQYVDRWLLSSQSMAEASAGGVAYNAYLFAVDDLEEFTRFIDLRHRQGGGPVALPGDGLILTEKLSELLKVEVGDTVTLVKDDDRVEAVVADIVENYVQHYVYLSNDYYRQLFREAPENNVAMVVYGSEVGQSQSDRVSADLMAMDAVTSYSYIATIRDSFTDSMEAIDYAVIIIILAAAALAFVVLYNLTNINITERTRELATLKVLGFYDGETTAYVYRENIFLTAFGILLGLVMGRALHAWMVLTVEVDLVMFGRTAPAYAYVLAAVLTVVFSVTVNIAAHFRLKKVDMVESLKTVE